MTILAPCQGMATWLDRFQSIARNAARVVNGADEPDEKVESLGRKRRQVLADSLVGDGRFRRPSTCIWVVGDPRESQDIDVFPP